jgi:hypothetical protein
MSDATCCGVIEESFVNAKSLNGVPDHHLWEGSIVGKVTD